MKDNCPGFGDPENPKPVLNTKGVFGGQNFFIHVHNLTIDTGRGNPGAVGLLWFLGTKTEKDRTIIGTTGGGKTELLGGLLYKNRQRIGPAPAFTSDNSSVSLVYKVVTYGHSYQVHVREARGHPGASTPVAADQFPAVYAIRGI